jgi:nucleotide-binding universal stress UspA family protein
MPYSTVVVGTDGSATAETAVKHAGRLAADHGARLVIVTAYEADSDEHAPTAGARSASDVANRALTDRDQAEEKARYGEFLASEVGASSVVAQAVAGNPPDVLLAAAADFGADVIVVGSKGLTGASRFVLGSVASAVSHHAPCDVLIVQTAD